jgi:hypothetical protein
MPAAEAAAWEEAEQCGPEVARRELWAALRWLREGSSIERQRKCRWVPTSDLVAIEKRLQRASYSGLQTCGRPGCPACGPKIAAERAADIALALTAWHLAGGTVAMITLTLPHTAAQSLAELLDGLTPAWSAIRANKTPRRLLKAHTAGWIKRLEVTLGRNGWHPHLHVLLFLQPGTTLAELAELADAWYAAWSGRLIRAGLGMPSREHGVDAKRLDLAGGHADIARYVAKTEYAAAPGSLSAALELANAGTKRGRRAGSRSPMQLLADAVRDGLADDVARWREYEQALRGRPHLLWSDGLRARLLAELPELSDQEAAESNDGAGRLLATLDRDTWRLVRRGHAAHVLEWAEAFDDDDQAREHVFEQLARHHLLAGSCPAQAQPSDAARASRPESAPPGAPTPL